MRKVRKFSTITFRVPTDIKGRIEDYADSELQTVSNICRRAVLQTLREWESGISDDPFGEKEN
jgi:predicted transcriptional regulator